MPSTQARDAKKRAAGKSSAASMPKVSRGSVRRVGGEVGDSQVATNVDSCSDVCGTALFGGVPMNYILDTGASLTTITTVAQERVQGAIDRGEGDKTQSVVWHDVRPYEVALADGKRVTVRHGAVADITLKTVAGDTVLRRVQVQVIPGDADEVLIGRPELDRLGIVSPAEQLRRVQEEADEEGQAVADEVRRVMLVDALCSTDVEEQEQEIRHMVERVKKQGGSDPLLQELDALVQKHRDLWRVKLGTDPPAKVTPCRIEILNPNVPIRVTKVRRYSTAQPHGQW